MAVRSAVRRKPRFRVQVNKEARLVLVRGGPYDKAGLYLTPGVGSLNLTLGEYHGYYGHLGTWFDIKPAQQEA